MASDSQDIGQGSASGLPSYEEAHQVHKKGYVLPPDTLQPLREHYVLPSDDLQRLFWKFDGGPLETSIFVMSGTRYISEAELEPYYRQTTSNDATSHWHPISQSSVSDPKISSVTVRAFELSRWESEWLALHRDHSEPEAFDPDEQLWGPLTDRARLEAEAPLYLLKCCNETRPPRENYELLVRASGEFLTVHDFVSQVHPWLAGFRQEALWALGYLDGPLPDTTELMIQPGVKVLSILRKALWVTTKRMPPVDSSQSRSRFQTPEAIAAQDRRLRSTSFLEMARRVRASHNQSGWTDLQS